MIYTIATALLLSISLSAEPFSPFPPLFLQELCSTPFSYHQKATSPLPLEPAPEVSALATEDPVAQSDAQAYHEMMVHVPLMAHENPKSILIIGGGNGSTLTEALKHLSLQSAVIVDTNPIQSSEPRVTVVVEDPARYVKKCNKTFDIILCDTAQEIFPSEFFEDCKDLLNKRGILVNYSGYISFNQDTLNAISANRASHFKHNTYYLVSTSRGQVAIGWSSDKKYRLSESIIGEKLTKIKEPMLYYTPEIHKASFALPNFLYSYSSRGPKL